MNIDRLMKTMKVVKEMMEEQKQGIKHENAFHTFKKKWIEETREEKEVKNDK